MPDSVLPTAAIPCPPRHFLLGHLKEVYGDQQLDFYLKSLLSHGDLFGIEAPRGNRWYFIAHPDEIEQLLLGSYRTFHKGAFWNRVRRILGNGLLTNDGDTWRDHRRAMAPAFHAGRHPDFAATMTGAIADMVERWKQFAETGKTFDLLDEMSRVTLQNAGLTMFSTDFAPLYDRMGDELAFIVRRMNVRNFWKPYTTDPRIHSAKRKLRRVIDELIDKRRAEIEKGHEPNDLLSALLRGRDSKTNEPFTNRELHDEILTFIFVGHETTALSLAWAFYLLAKNPEWVAKAQKEVDEVLGDQLPTLESVARLPTVKNIFQETLRLYPPVWGLARLTTQDVEMGGYKIPAKTTLITIPYVTHRHPDFWPEPEKFDPDRFLPEIEKTRPKYAYFPFGGGPRLCIGLHFAMLEAQLVLAQVIQSYTFALAPTQKEVQLALWATLRPKNGIKLTIQTRK